MESRVGEPNFVGALPGMLQVRRQSPAPTWAGKRVVERPAWFPQRVGVASVSLNVLPWGCVGLAVFRFVCWGLGFPQTQTGERECGITGGLESRPARRGSSC